MITKNNENRKSFDDSYYEDYEPQYYEAQGYEDYESQYYEQREDYEPQGYEQREDYSLDELVKSSQVRINVPVKECSYVKPVSLSEEFDMLDVSFIVKCAFDGDFGDALLFAELYRGRICYDSSIKKNEGWHLWAGHHWKRDTKPIVPLLIPTKLAAQYLMAKSAITEQLETPPDENPYRHLTRYSDDNDFKKNLKAIAEKLNKKAASLSYAGKLNPIFRFARSLMVAHDPNDPDFDVWDSNPWLLPVKNGVLSLRDGQVFFRNGLPSDFVRAFAPVAWQGIDAHDVGFADFLSEVLGGATNHQETLDYVQRLLGYSILGSAHENNFAILYGDRGQNGKGTLFKILSKVLGNLCGSVSEDVFVSKKKSNAGQASPHLMTLRGLRIAWCAETDEGERLNGSQVKRLTGNEPLRARDLNQSEIEWQPSHTLFLMTNDKPHVNAEDDAIWLRVALLPFLLSFVKDPDPNKPYQRKADPHLLEKLTTEEAKSGILALLVQWCQRYQNEGLALPASLVAEREAYRSDEDTLGAFVEEYCFVDTKTKVEAKKLYTAYAQWATEAGSKAMSNHAFGRKMKKRFTRKRLNQGQVYLGIGLLVPDKGIF